MWGLLCRPTLPPRRCFAQLHQHRLCFSPPPPPLGYAVPAASFTPQRCHAQLLEADWPTQRERAGHVRNPEVFRSCLQGSLVDFVTVECSCTSLQRQAPTEPWPFAANTASPGGVRWAKAMLPGEPCGVLNQDMHPPLQLSPSEQPPCLQRLPAQPSVCSTCQVPASCKRGPARALLKHNPQARQCNSSRAALCNLWESLSPSGDGWAAPGQCFKQELHSPPAHLLGRPAPGRAQAACLSRQRAAHLWSGRCPPLGHRLRPSSAQEGLAQVVMHRQGSMVGPWRLRVQV